MWLNTQCSAHILIVIHIHNINSTNSNVRIHEAKKKIEEKPEEKQQIAHTSQELQIDCTFANAIFE